MMQGILFPTLLPLATTIILHRQQIIFLNTEEKKLLKHKNYLNMPLEGIYIL